MFCFSKQKQWPIGYTLAELQKQQQVKQVPSKKPTVKNMDSKKK